MGTAAPKTLFTAPSEAKSLLTGESLTTTADVGDEEISNNKKQKRFRKTVLAFRIGSPVGHKCCVSRSILFLLNSHFIGEVED